MSRPKKGKKREKGERGDLPSALWSPQTFPFPDPRIDEEKEKKGKEGKEHVSPAAFSSLPTPSKKRKGRGRKKEMTPVTYPPFQFVTLSGARSMKGGEEKKKKEKKRGGFKPDLHQPNSPMLFRLGAVENKGKRREKGGKKERSGLRRRWRRFKKDGAGGLTRKEKEREGPKRRRRIDRFFDASSNVMEARMFNTRAAMKGEVEGGGEKERERKKRRRLQSCIL